jgi:hypothetical protein
MGGRKPKPREIDAEQQAFLAAQANAQASGIDKPYDPGSLTMIVEALLQRIGRKSLAEEKMLRMYIQALAGNERQSGDKFIRNQAGYMCIAYAPTPKGEHLSQTIKHQWTILLNYFEQHKFTERVSWVQDHLPAIVEQVKTWLCLCPYKLKFQRALGRISTLELQAERPGATPLSAAAVIKELLADLHNRAAPTLIQKHIKAPQFIPSRGHIFDKRRSPGILNEYLFSVAIAKKNQAIARQVTIEYLASLSQHK